MKKRKIKTLAILVAILSVLVPGVVLAAKIVESNKVSYDNSETGLPNNVQGAIDELYKRQYVDLNAWKQKYYELLSEKIEKGEKIPLVDFLVGILKDDEATILRDDGTEDHNMRYMGKTPNNYITFEGENDWRIIGVFNNIEDGNGNRETRIKIIKDTPLDGTTKAWNDSNSNIWDSSRLNKELNESSYASSSLIDTAIWYLGDRGGSYYTFTATEAYDNERTGNVSTGNNIKWSGKIALMYPSDYGFASSVCKDGSKVLGSSDGYDYDYRNPSCTESNWLLLGSYEWLLSPFAISTSSVRVLGSTGSIGNVLATNSWAARPTVYLKSSVICKNCSESTAGTKSNPFQIDLG